MNIVSDPPVAMTMSLARQHVEALDQLPRPTLVTCRTGPRSSAVIYLYAGLKAGATEQEVLAQAQSRWRAVRAIGRTRRLGQTRARRTQVNASRSQAMTSADDPTITVYGAPWCPHCKRVRRFLAAHRVPYDHVDIDERPEAIERLKELQGGKQIIPLVDFGDGTHEVNPSDEALAGRFGLAGRGRSVRV